MERILLVAILSLTFHSEAFARGPFARFFKVIPEEQAHTSYGKAQDDDFDPKSIKVFVWNIKKTEEEGWKEEFTNFGKEKDLFLIQEAYQNKLFTSTLGTFSDVRWDMGISFLFKLQNNQGTGNMIGSKVEPTEVLVKHTPDTEPLVETPKATTFAKYAIEGTSKELLVISVHGINLTSFGSFKRHMLQTEEEIVRHDGPVLFAGDFNTRTKKRTQYLRDMIKRLNFETVQFKNGQHRMKFALTPYYLDHSFVRGLAVKNAEVYKDSRGSDHKPMALELAYTE